ncbi:hypothetical protein WBP06_19980 [Novosphingobium sp. BL-8H]
MPKVHEHLDGGLRQRAKIALEMGIADLADIGAGCPLDDREQAERIEAPMSGVAQEPRPCGVACQRGATDVRGDPGIREHRGGGFEIGQDGRAQQQAFGFDHRRDRGGVPPF